MPEPLPSTDANPAGGRGPIVVLTGGGPLPWIIVNAVVARYGPVTVLEEEPESMALLFRRRLRRLGPFAVTGQIAFGFYQRILRQVSARRLAKLMADHGLEADRPASCRIVPISSINAETCRRELQRLSPAVVLVVGTRMIGRQTLAAVDAPFINYHAGINPKYRGMCGGYWALAEGDAENFGATVHLVDHGVDTGGILYTATIAAVADDNFITYPFRLAVAGRAIVLAAIDDALHGRLHTLPSALPSRQWYHPTLWGYLWRGLTRKVW